MGMDGDDARLSGCRSVPAAVWLLLAHAVVTVVLIATTFAYGLSLDATIGRDELYRLEPAFGWAIAGAFLPLPVATVATWLLEPVRSDRAWVAPAVGMCASVALCVAMLPLIHPAPVTGG
ncbi:hypothetical protein [Leifsonia sp. NPDC077715]|uniref:hypothetical protein n=1 Tax=Leifsonia sp. NPDC077715 TaxID=3155539 RepID=UPI003439B5B4